MDKIDLEQRMARAEAILAEVATGNLDQRLELSADQDAFTSLEMGINFMIMDLRAMNDRERRRTDELRERQVELERQLDIISKQERAILELSTPVMQIWEDILILPVIGTVDTVSACDADRVARDGRLRPLPEGAAAIRASSSSSPRRERRWRQVLCSMGFD